ncbi:nucleotidyltransferase family protein [Candidatus Chloroploca asiatica]|uniref:Polymerase nucleotidyl transferase domain-containing protein n=1 Tax=Candidatus Chloroploca asiatica TaxID=1506545 RepID=A0A2H3KXP7_9CHLR|nr:nucleotidyltransferase family protein [Candidatus Chloroploca asiatica]PDW00254.1 hypothetical protein A9Q02_10570 [Candidatus Chloroploca asiatica]
MSNVSAQASAPGELSSLLEILRQHLPELARRYHIRSLGLFGSYARQEQKPNSDLDVLVEFEQMPGLFTYVELQERLSELLRVPVDLVHRPDLKPGIGERILAEVIII